MPAAMPQMELVDIVEMPEEPEPIVEPPPPKEEAKYGKIFLIKKGFAYSAYRTCTSVI